MIRIDGTEYNDMPSAEVFADATEVGLADLPLVVALPDIPNATRVWLENLPLVETLLEMPKMPNAPRLRLVK